jgi:hypothetical protein
VVALISEVLTLTRATEEPLPPPYAGVAPKIDLAVVDTHLSVPTNIRFIQTLNPIDQPLTGREILGHFVADAANGIAAYPADFDALHGSNSELFETTVMSDSGQPRTALRASSALVQTINSKLPEYRIPQNVSYTLTVTARDRFGNVSEPADIAIDLTVGPLSAAQPVVPVPAASPEAKAEPAPLTDLQRIARDIALIVDPNRTPTYFAAYQRAVHLPEACRASDDDSAFVGNYRAALDHARAKLSARNLGGFYAGICEAWQRNLNEQEAARVQAQNAQTTVEMRNQSARVAAEARHVAAWAVRNLALMVVGGALSAFLSISLLLAFLAIENHSKAMREAVEAIAGAKRPGEAAGS